MGVLRSLRSDLLWLKLLTEKIQKASPVPDLGSKLK